MYLNSGQFGGILSFLSFVAAAVFLGLLTFSVTLGSVPLLAAGLFCLALAFVLSRLGV